MLFRLVYLSVTGVFGLLRLLPVSGRDKDVEIVVLRHQIAVLQRQLGTTRPRFSAGDRAFLAALLHRLPRGLLGRIRLLARPDTVLRSLMDLARPGLRGRQSSYCSQSAVTYVLRGAVAVSGAEGQSCPGR